MTTQPQGVTPTPRSDAALFDCFYRDDFGYRIGALSKACPDGDWVQASFARELERELAEAKRVQFAGAAESLKWQGTSYETEIATLRAQLATAESQRECLLAALGTIGESGRAQGEHYSATVALNAIASAEQARKAEGRTDAERETSL